MSEQLGLAMDPPKRGRKTRLPRGTVGSLDEQFRAWITKYPEMYALFEKYALDVVARGFKRYSAKSIIERVRWHVHVEKKKGEQFLFNNNYTSRLARMFVEKHPEHRDLFELRELRS